MTAINCTIRTTTSMLNKRTVLVVSEAFTGTDVIIPMGRMLYDVADLLKRKYLEGTLEERINQVRDIHQGLAEESLRKSIANIAAKKAQENAQ